MLKNIIFIFFCIITKLNAIDIDLYFQKAIKLNLAEHPTWLKLLHYNQESRRSEILDKDFFISEEGSINPNKELESTLLSFLLPAENDARCRFPARFLWLDKQLSFPEELKGFPNCEKLKNWSLKSNIQSVSFCLVSGYFGNPASTFGHALVRFNTKSFDDTYGLFDTSINFGALVPKSENIISYIGKGIFGGYKAGFSDKYYYTQDMVYTKSEHRDVWNYELNFTDFQRDLLIFHTWEILGRKFQYYFLKENCAYRLAELLDLVIEEPFFESKKFWYSPMDLFQRIESLNERNVSEGRLPLVKEVNFIPSARKKINSLFKGLSQDKLRVCNDIILNGLKFSKNRLDEYSVIEKTKILNASLSYLQYQINAVKPKKDVKLETRRRKLLLARLNLPSADRKIEKVDYETSPAKGQSPFRYGVGFSQQINDREYLNFKMTLYDNSAIGRNNLDGGELVAGDISMSFNKRDGLKFDKLTYLKVKKRDLKEIVIAKEKKMSWDLGAFSERIHIDSKYDHNIEGAIGKSYSFLNSNQISFMIGCGLHSVYPYARYNPYIEHRFDYKLIRIISVLGVENRKDQIETINNLELQIDLDKNYSISAAYSNETINKFYLSYNIYR